VIALLSKSKIEATVSKEPENDEDNRGIDIRFADWDGMPVV
jgi:hypothetical protein